MICFTIIYRPLTEMTANAGVILGVYTICALTGGLLVNLLGGQLYTVGKMLPFTTMLLPANIILGVVCLVYLICCWFIIQFKVDCVFN